MHLFTRPYFTPGMRSPIHCSILPFFYLDCTYWSLHCKYFRTTMSCNSLLANVVCFTCTTLNKALSYLILCFMVVRYGGNMSCRLLIRRPWNVGSLSHCSHSSGECLVQSFLLQLRGNGWSLFSKIYKIIECSKTNSPQQNFLASWLQVNEDVSIILINGENQKETGLVNPIPIC